MITPTEGVYNLSTAIFISIGQADIMRVGHSWLRSALAHTEKRTELIRPFFVISSAYSFQRPPPAQGRPVRNGRSRRSETPPKRLAFSETDAGASFTHRTCYGVFTPTVARALRVRYSLNVSEIFSSNLHSIVICERLRSYKDNQSADNI